ncbi:MAG: restriction endonuclease subunit S, partial [Prevotella sp.]|nr:restriction endonuclease subunit S [Prevotella sp.]
MRKMKDSGIKWIGEIPKEYKISKIKYVSDIFGRIGFRGYTEKDLVDGEEEGAITLSPSNLNNMKMDYTKCTYLNWKKYEESPEIKINNGDVLFVKRGSTYGKSAY